VEEKRRTNQPQMTQMTADEEIVTIVSLSSAAICVICG
jgi:hypothetical protein